jgi:cytochrome P450
MIAPALSERAMKSFEPSLAEYINVYLSQILKASQASQAVNMTEKTTYLALDIVTRLSFGYPLNVQTSQENRFVLKALQFGVYRNNVWQHLYFLSRLWVYSVFDKVFSRAKYTRLLDEMIRSRVARGANGGRDFYAFISEGADFDDTRREGIWWEAHFLLVAGK